jgi:hypothetical protein
MRIPNNKKKTSVNIFTRGDMAARRSASGTTGVARRLAKKAKELVDEGGRADQREAKLTILYDNIQDLTGILHWILRGAV